MDFVHKIAQKQGITYDQAEHLAITREFIKYVVQEQEIYVLPRRTTDYINSNCS